MNDGPRLLWNHLRIDIAPSVGDSKDTFAVTIGPGGLTREQALEDVQWFLDRFADQPPTPYWGTMFRASAENWRGGVPDDVIQVGGTAWAVYMHFDTVHPIDAAVAWCKV